MTGNEHHRSEEGLTAIQSSLAPRLSLDTEIEQRVENWAMTAVEDLFGRNSARLGWRLRLQTEARVPTVSA